MHLYKIWHSPVGFLGFFFHIQSQNQMERVMKSLKYFHNRKTVSLMVSDLNFLEQFLYFYFCKNWVLETIQVVHGYRIPRHIEAI